jgi:hypothetical protein
MVSFPADPPEDGDWRATLVALQQLHARLLTMADALRIDLARPAATWDVARDAEVTGLGWELGRLPAAERIALYESVCVDLQMLEALTEQLEQLADKLEARGPTIPPR